MTEAPTSFRYVSKPRRTQEDRRFVTGKGHFVADIVPDNTLHVALVPSQEPAARIISIDKSAALALPGVHDVITGDELAAAVEPMMNGLDTPAVKRYAMAVDRIRYCGEWVAAVVADTRAIAEDAAELVELETEPSDFILDAEEAYRPDSLAVHEAHGSNILLDRTFTWGPVEQHFSESARELSFRVTWGRSSTVPIETFGVLASWDGWRDTLDVWASIQMPKYADQIARALRIPMNTVRVHQDVDVGGSYGVKRGIKHTVLAGYISRKLNRPIRLIEDRLENMRAGDAHGPDRIFDISIAYEDDGRIRSMKMRALDNAGAYAGRAPFQLGKPIGAIVGPYTIESVEYQAISVTTNKAAQEAVRGFGQAPTNYAIETALDRVAAAVGLDRVQIRRRNYIPSDQFPYLIPSGTSYDSGDYQTVTDKVMTQVGWDDLVRQRDALRADGQLAGIGIAACLEPSGGNSSFEPLLNPANTTTTWMDSCRIMVDGAGTVTATIHTTSSGQGHQTLTATIIGEVLEIDPDQIRVIHADSQTSLPSNSPVGSRMAVMLGGAAFNAAGKLKDKLKRIAAKQFGASPDEVVYSEGTFATADGDQSLGWMDVVTIAHRYFHLLPDGEQPGLEVTDVYQVPTGGGLPTEDGRVQMYPCHSFEFHCVLLSFDPILAKPEIHRYVIGHDCGTVINPHIVKGMTLGGIAHGIGAALFEEFTYDDQGQMNAQTLADYLLPSSHEIPAVEIVHHCTPSPFTVLGQKGSGESGYLGAPAAISGAVNDALAPLGITVDKLPIRTAALSDRIAAAANTQS
ncbi:MAG: 2-furoyl-CoA dehydrogenase large subunit [Alphaproteobacteria bacterium]|jgi:2-furoyl-CoA dehydrogenase large subunit